MYLLNNSFPDASKIIELLSDLNKGESGFSGTNYNDSDFELQTYFQYLKDESNGKGLQNGYVPQTTFWAYDNNKNIIGMSRLRHYLNSFLLTKGGHIGYYVKKSERGKGFGTELLRKTIKEARFLGIDKVLVTTDIDNIPSINVIEKCNGILEDERQDLESKTLYKRFWINT
jgi:predicted acetyltransferase